MDHANDAIDQMSKFVTTNTKTVTLLGAQSMVLGKFFDAVLPQLTTTQRVETAEAFRQAIKEARLLMDELTLPVEYHTALLDLTNAILGTLDQESSRHRLD